MELNLKRWRAKAARIQQTFYSLLSDREWDQLDRHEEDFMYNLTAKIALALYAQTCESCLPEQADSIKATVKRIVELIDTNDGVYIGYVYVNIYNETVNDDSLLPLIRIMGSDDRNLYMEIQPGRIYLGWDEFLQFKYVSGCHVCYPKDGYYQKQNDQLVSVVYDFASEKNYPSNVHDVAVSIYFPFYDFYQDTSINLAAGKAFIIINRNVEPTIPNTEDDDAYVFGAWISCIVHLLNGVVEENSKILKITLDVPYFLKCIRFFRCIYHTSPRVNQYKYIFTLMSVLLKYKLDKLDDDDCVDFLAGLIFFRNITGDMDDIRQLIFKINETPLRIQNFFMAHSAYQQTKRVIVINSPCTVFCSPVESEKSYALRPESAEASEIGEKEEELKASVEASENDEEAVESKNRLKESDYAERSKSDAEAEKSEYNTETSKNDAKSDNNAEMSDNERESENNSETYENEPELENNAETSEDEPKSKNNAETFVNEPESENNAETSENNLEVKEFHDNSELYENTKESVYVPEMFKSAEEDWWNTPGTSKMIEEDWWNKPGTSKMTEEDWRNQPGTSKMFDDEWWNKPGTSKMTEEDWRNTPGTSKMAEKYCSNIHGTMRKTCRTKMEEWPSIHEPSENTEEEQSKNVAPQNVQESEKTATYDLNYVFKQLTNMSEDAVNILTSPYASREIVKILKENKHTINHLKNDRTMLDFWTDMNVKLRSHLKQYENSFKNNFVPKMKIETLVMDLDETLKRIFESIFGISIPSTYQKLVCCFDRIHESYNYSKYSADLTAYVDFLVLELVLYRAVKIGPDNDVLATDIFLHSTSKYISWFDMMAVELKSRKPEFILSDVCGMINEVRDRMYDDNFMDTANVNFDHLYKVGREPHLGEIAYSTHNQIELYYFTRPYCEDFDMKFIEITLRFLMYAKGIPQIDMKYNRQNEYSIFLSYNKKMLAFTYRTRRPSGLTVGFAVHMVFDEERKDDD